MPVTSATEGDSCACGAQFLNGAWWTRMGGLGHTHRMPASAPVDRAEPPREASASNEDDDDEVSGPRRRQ
jgi:hypothetical protein